MSRREYEDLVQVLEAKRKVRGPMRMHPAVPRSARLAPHLCHTDKAACHQPASQQVN